MSDAVGRQVINKDNEIKTVQDCTKGKYIFTDGTSGGVRGWKRLEDSAEKVMSKEEVVANLVTDRKETKTRKLSDEEILFKALDIIHEIVSFIKSRKDK